MSQVKIPNLNTFADLIDRLIVEVNKLAYFENKKREAHKAGNPDPEQIAYWDNKSRDACEYRSMLKNAINEMLGEVCASGEYKTLAELRTFAPPDKSIADILADKCLLGPNVVQEIMRHRDLC